MSGLHISLLTLRALISTTVCRRVLVCVCVHERVNKCASVCVSLLYGGVCHLHFCNHEHLSVFTHVHSVSPKLPHCRPEWTDRMMKEEIVRKDVESHLTVLAYQLM